METTQIEAAGHELVTRSRALTVTDRETFEIAAQFLLGVKDYRAKVAATFDPIIKKAHAAHREALAQKQKLDEPADDAERFTKRLMGDWKAREDRRLAEEARQAEAQRRREAEEAALAEAAAAEQAGDREAAEQILDAPIHVAPVVPPPAAPKVAGVSFRTTWGYEIEDVAKLPREYLKPDTAKIGAVVRAMKGGAKIAGVRVFEQQGVSAGRA